jgi:hypothetical protein
MPVGEPRASRPVERAGRAPPAVQVLIRQRMVDVAVLEGQPLDSDRARSDALEAPQLPG